MLAGSGLLSFFVGLRLTHGIVVLCVYDVRVACLCVALLSSVDLGVCCVLTLCGVVVASMV